jgi:hypothetical protein
MNVTGQMAGTTISHSRILEKLGGTDVVHKARAPNSAAWTRSSSCRLTSNSLCPWHHPAAHLKRLQGEFNHRPSGFVAQSERLNLQVPSKN